MPLSTAAGRRKCRPPAPPGATGATIGAHTHQESHLPDPNKVGDDLFTGGSIGNESGPRSDWTAEETYWRANWSGRPYVSGDRDFEYYRPGYRYGHDAAGRHRGKQWSEVETNLQADWDRYEHRNDRRWDEVKHAVRDAFDRITKR